MVVEQVLTILMGTTVGAAAVLFTVKPREIEVIGSFVSGVSSMEAISLPARPVSYSFSYEGQMPGLTAAPASAAKPAGVVAAGHKPPRKLTRTSTGGGKAGAAGTGGVARP